MPLKFVKGLNLSKKSFPHFRDFYGLGTKISNMAVNMLYYEGHLDDDIREEDIKIAPDYHVKRVMERLGFVKSNPSDEEVIQTARELNPSYPAMLDTPLFHVGKGYCFENNPNCSECPLSKYYCYANR